MIPSLKYKNCAEYQRIRLIIDTICTVITKRSQNYLEDVIMC